MNRFLCALLAVCAVLGVTVCSVSAAAVLYGDINADSRVNNRDLGIFQQYLNDWDVTIDQTAADVTADGRVNNRDLGLLQQYLNEWDVQLGPDEPITPQVELPQGGYDPDGRGFILVESVTQEGDTVSVVFVNVTDRWMSEETSYLCYICTDAEGNELSIDDPYYGTLYFGMLEAGERVTLTFTLPEGTAKVAFGECRIVYWTQWQ